MFEQFALAL